MLQTPNSLYEAERQNFNKGDPNAPPRLGVSLSGGGNRSAAFSIGVLRALREKGYLNKIDVISAVSGGSYALSWFLLQPYYYSTLVDSRTSRDTIQAEMLDLEGPFQTYLAANAKPIGAIGLADLLFKVPLLLALDLAYMNVLRLPMLLLRAGNRQQSANLSNGMSISKDAYRKGIQRTYQILCDPESKKPLNNRRLGFKESSRRARDFVDFTDVLPITFSKMSEFAKEVGLPSFVFNATVRPPHPDSPDPLRQRIFELGPEGFGSESCGYVRWEETDGLGWEPGMPPRHGSWWKDYTRNEGASVFSAIRNFNIAPAISGAALSGTNLDSSKKMIRWLLNLANLGLEYEVPRPGDERRTVRLSDGGHSENLGAWALLRRRCETVVIVDAEEDPELKFQGYATLRDRAKEELEISLKVPSIDEGKFSAREPVCNGEALHKDGKRGNVYYVKLSFDPSLAGDYRELIEAYATRHRQFPHESTADQFFQEEQFRAYRELGYVVSRQLPGWGN